MKKKKSVLTALLATCLVVGGGVLTGCNLLVENISGTDDPNDNPSTTTTYKIAFAEKNGVDASLSAEEATAGTTIQITINSVPDDYELVNITTDVSGVNVTGQSSTLYTFTMPESDVNLTINVAETIKESYTLQIIDNAGAGILSVRDGGASGNSGSIVTADSDTGLYTITTSATAYVTLLNEGTYAFYLNDTEGSVSYDIANTQATFTMPAKNSVLRIETATAYNVTVTFDDQSHISEWSLISGGVTINTTSFAANTSLGIQIITVTGYEVVTVTADTTDINYLSSTEWTFTMPENNVAITVTTREAQSTGEGGDDTNGTVTLSRDSSSCSVNLYYGDVLTNYSIYPGDYSITNYSSMTFTPGTMLAFTAAFSGTNANIYEIDDITLNGNSILNSLNTYYFTYERYGTTNTNIEYSFYSFEVQAGVNAIVISTKDRDIPLEIILDEGEGVKLYYQNDLDNEITGVAEDGKVTYTAKYQDDLQIEFTNTDTSKKVTNVDKSYQYTSLTKVAGKDNTYTFAMPGQASFTLDPYWGSENNVVVTTSNAPSGLLISATVADEATDSGTSFVAYGGETVELTLSWTDTTKAISTVIATTDNQESVSVDSSGDGTTGSIYTFTMPESSVSVTLTFEDVEQEPEADTYSVKVRNTGEITSIGDVYLANSNSGNDYDDYTYSNPYRVWSGFEGGEKLNLYLYNMRGNYNSYDINITVDGDVVELEQTELQSYTVAWNFTMPEADVVITIDWSTPTSEPEDETYSIKIRNTGAMTSFDGFYLEDAATGRSYDDYAVSDSYRVWTGFEGGESLTFGFWNNQGSYNSYTVEVIDENNVFKVDDEEEEEDGIRLDYQSSALIYWSFTMPAADVAITINWTAI